jgi:hypothetical protein
MIIEAQRPMVVRRLALTFRTFIMRCVHVCMFSMFMWVYSKLMRQRLILAQRWNTMPLLHCLCWSEFIQFRGSKCNKQKYNYEVYLIISTFKVHPKTHQEIPYADFSRVPSLMKKKIFGSNQVRVPHGLTPFASWVMRFQCGFLYHLLQQHPENSFRARRNLYTTCIILSSLSSRY